MSVQKDWDLFKSPVAASPPAPVPPDLLREVSQDLSPTWLRVGGKAAVAHALASAWTLTVCPQFGIGFFGAHGPLSAIFHSFGAIGCQLACGAFYFGTFGLLWSLMLRPLERRFLGYQKGLWLAIALIVGTLGAFWMVNPQAVTAVPLWAWGVGAFLSFLPSWSIAVLRNIPVRRLT